MPTITSEHPSYEDYFEKQLWAKISSSDQSFEKKNKNWYSSRENTMMSGDSFYQDPIKMRWLLSPLNIPTLNITLRVISKLRFPHRIIFWKTIRMIDRVQGKNHDELRIFYQDSFKIITSYHTHFEYHFERNFQANISPYNILPEQPE